MGAVEEQVAATALGGLLGDVFPGAAAPDLDPGQVGPEGADVVAAYGGAVGYRAAFDSEGIHCCDADLMISAGTAHISSVGCPS